MKRSRFIVGTYLATISIAVLSLGVSLAWYVSSTLLNVETIEMTFYSDQNLLISKTADNFKEYTKEDPLVGESSVRLDLFKPVTSMYTFTEDWTSSQSFYTDEKPSDSASQQEKDANHYYYNWLRNNESTPVLLDSYDYKPLKVPDLPLQATSGYYSEVLYLYSNSNVYVTIDGTTGSDGSKATTFQSDDKANLEYAKKHHPGEEEAYVEKMKNVTKSFRLSVLSPNRDNSEKFDYTIIDPYKESTTDDQGNKVYKDTYFAGRLNVNKDDEFDWYNDHTFDSKMEIIYGDIDESTRTPSQALDYYDEKAGETGIAADSSQPTSSFNARTDKNTYPFNLDKAITHGLKAAKEHSIALEEQGGADSDLMIPVYAHTPTRIVFSLYMEGWDTDCINDTMGATFTANISFKIAREMGL